MQFLDLFERLLKSSKGNQELHESKCHERRADRDIENAAARPFMVDFRDSAAELAGVPDPVSAWGDCRDTVAKILSDG